MMTEHLQYSEYALDLETLGTLPTAAIVSIGAVAFDTETNTLGPKFYHTIDMDDVLGHGLTVDASTLKWWLNQPHAVREAISTDRHRPNLRQVLLSLHGWAQDHLCDDALCWTHATFDPPVLCYAMKQLELEDVTKFWNQRDLRTLQGMYHQLIPDAPPLPSFKGTKHNAGDDAEHEARLVMYMKRALTKLSPVEMSHD